VDDLESEQPEPMNGGKFLRFQHFLSTGAWHGQVRHDIH